MPSWTLPPPRELGWTLRRVEDAETSDTRLPDGRRQLRIKHELLRGVTRPMLAWWFQNFDRPCEFQGQRYAQAYLLWHPVDHHSVAPTRDAQGRISPGQTIHVREAFGGDMRFALDQRATIGRMDETGVTLLVKRAGRIAFHLAHEFNEVDGGIQYDSCMTLGLETGGPLRLLANYVAVPREFSTAKATAWLKHNVEEVGCFMNMLPELYDQARAAGSA